MQVVLNKDISGLGHRGDVVNVKNGYFRNYLLPRGLAQHATATLVKMAEERQAKAEAAKAAVLENAKEVLENLAGLSVTVSGKASKKGKLYAAISEKDVAEAISAEKKVDLDPSFIKMEHFKEVGEHVATVDFGGDMKGEVKVVVEAASE